jgi:hypothetical protein
MLRSVRSYDGNPKPVRFPDRPKSVLACRTDSSHDRAQGAETERVARDTTTGKDFEVLADTALDRGGYRYDDQVRIGQRPAGGRHNVDRIIYKSGQPPRLVSFKWQSSKGTAEQKVPFEVICLLEAVRGGGGEVGALFPRLPDCDRAYLVLGGDGWTLRDWYLRGGLRPYLAYEPQVVLLGLEAFLGRAIRSEL